MLVKSVKRLNFNCWRSFAKWKEPSNDHLTEQEIQKHRDDFKNSFTERHQLLKQAERIAVKRLIEDSKTDENLWFNKLNALSDYEMETMPYNWLLKWGGYLNSIDDT